MLKVIQIMYLGLQDSTNFVLISARPISPQNVCPNWLKSYIKWQILKSGLSG
jgi:hypothetical protein